MKESTTATFRRLLAGPDVIMAPGAPDPFYARLIAHKGFPAVYMTGELPPPCLDTTSLSTLSSSTICHNLGPPGSLLSPVNSHGR